MSCLRCLRCRRRRAARSPNDDDDSEDSEVYWIRRRREEQQRQKTLQRDEFLNNVLRTKTIVVETENPVEPSSDEFIIPQQSDICCAICLLPYGEGDPVAFSHNPSCQHHFHRECIMSWLKENNACPCCRQDYLAFGDDDQRNEDDSVLRIRSTTTENNLPVQQDEYYGISQHIIDQLYGTGIFQSSVVPRGSDNRGTEDPPPETRAQLMRTVQRLSQSMEQHVSLARTQLRDRLDNFRQRLQEQSVQEQTTGTSSPSHHRDDDEQRWERSVELVRNRVDRLRDAVIREIQSRRDGDHVTHHTDHGRRPESRSASRLQEGQRGMRQDDRLGEAIQAVQSSLRVHAGSLVDSIRNHSGGSLRFPSR